MTYYLEDVTRAYWPGALPWRGILSRGYPTPEAAYARALRIMHHYAARYGRGGPVLEIRSRSARWQVSTWTEGATRPTTVRDFSSAVNARRHAARLERAGRRVSVGPVLEQS